MKHTGPVRNAHFSLVVGTQVYAHEWKKIEINSLYFSSIRLGANMQGPRKQCVYGFESMS